MQASQAAALEVTKHRLYAARKEVLYHLLTTHHEAVVCLALLSTVSPLAKGNDRDVGLIGLEVLAQGIRVLFLGTRQVA